MHSVYRPGQLADRRLLGRASSCCRSPGAPAAAALDRDPGQRGRHDRARLRPLLPAHPRRRGRDRPRADRRRARAASTCAARDLHTPHRGRAAVAARAATGATTRSSSTPTASPTSRSTWRRESSSRLARDHLQPGGVVIVNVGHPEGSTRSRRCSTATMATAFPHVAARPERATSTRMLVGPRAPAPRRALRARSPRCRRDCARWPRATARPARARRCAAATVYTDDRAPVEWLIDRSILKVAAQGEQ